MDADQHLISGYFLCEYKSAKDKPPVCFQNVDFFPILNLKRLRHFFCFMVSFLN
jgi:hypothetical protein